MSNVIQFPMDRIQLSPNTNNFFFDKIQSQTDQLEIHMDECLAQAIALEEQSQRILQMMEEMSE